MSSKSTTLKAGQKPLKGDDQEAQLSEFWQERTIFPGIIPKEVKFLINNISTIDKSFFRKLIKLALGYLQETLSHEKCESAFDNLCKSYQCQNEEDVLRICRLYSGVISLLRAVLRVNLKTIRENMLMADLQELGFPDVFSADVCKVVFGPAHNDIMSEILSHNPHLLKLENFEWKINNSESTQKSVEPLITMEMKTSDGEIHHFEVPVSSFHLLRHSVASILRQMELLDRRK